MVPRLHPHGAGHYCLPGRELAGRGRLLGPGAGSPCGRHRAPALAQVLHGPADPRTPGLPVAHRGIPLHL
ncbi:MAG: hypothetical protein M0C28_48755 [Candidatus Moduliflexus flocculans]|nr:hypothetical protein [Candidatus Moduliflexus flocculans]